MRQPSFGRLPGGERLDRIQRSAHYRNGQFENLHATPMLTGDRNYFQLFAEFLFRKNPQSAPHHPLPTVKTDLHNLAPGENVLVWFGHSSYFLQVDGKKILADPVFSGHASPVRFTTKAFPGTDVYGPADIPEIDFLFISHDHWDHLDYPTITALRPKIKKVITGLGTASHLERWGYEPSSIIEKDWNEHIELEDGFSADILPARHFSGRGLKRNQSIWVSMALHTPHHNLYLGGDSGYDDHFTDIGKKYGPFDLAILECGQFNASWKYIHMMPEQTVQAAQDLRAAKLLPVHWGKFSLSLHAWKEPIERAVAEASVKGVVIAHPMMGEKMLLDGPPPGYAAWWR